jgi:hypothetical protein
MDANNALVGNGVPWLPYVIRFLKSFQHRKIHIRKRKISSEMVALSCH